MAELTGVQHSTSRFSFCPFQTPPKMFHAYLSTFWRFYVLVLTPILLIPVVLHGLSTENTFLDGNDGDDVTGFNSTASHEALTRANSNYEPMVCAYVLLLMAVYWITAVLPLPVTSLIPLIAFPLFGVLSTVRAGFFYEDIFISKDPTSLTFPSLDFSEAR